MHETRDRLRESLQAEFERLGSHVALQNAIRKANQDVVGIARTVERRKLAGVLSGRAKWLAFQELDALNTFLEVRGTSLSEALRAPGLFRELVQSGPAIFLIGAKPHLQHNFMLSQWDIRGMTYLSRLIHRTSSGASSFLVDVPLRLGSSLAREYARALGGEEWLRLIRDELSPSLVCLGSPLACHAAEVMLADMFGVPPFQRAGRKAKHDAPFAFVWSPASYRALPSSFAKNGGKMRLLRRLYASTGWPAWGLLVDEKVCPPEEARDAWTTYGVLAVQRRARGQLWVVAAGVNGPATYAAALALERLSAAVEAGNDGAHSRITWAVVRTRVTRERDVLGLARWKAAPHEIVGGLRYWPR